MSVLTLSELRYSHPDTTPVLDGVTLTLPPGRTGLVGSNGSGKSTLIGLIAGRLIPTGGRIQIGGRLGILAQIEDPARPLAALFGQADGMALLRRAERGEASAEEIARADWGLEARLRAALARVGLDGIDPLAPIGRLSGGQRNRAALAAAFFDAPDLVLLDEPTNNLDREGRALVGELLHAQSGAALVASHDRELLAGMDHILALEAGRGTLTGGGWDAYAARRDAERTRAAARVTRAEQALKAVEAEIGERARKAAGRARSGKALRRSGSQGKMLTDMMKERAERTDAGTERLARRRREEARAEAVAARAAVAVEVPRRLDVRAAERTGQVLLEMVDVAFAYGGATVLDGVSFRLDRGERVAIDGPNGSGKSTLLRLAAGRLAPSAGLVRLGGRASFLDQFAEVLGSAGTLEARFREAYPGLDRNAAHAALARMGFRGAAGQADIAGLSGGERVQAALALVLAAPAPPDLLILDEPTNHLDLQALEAVESGLAGYPGALLVVSHDAVFLERIGITRHFSVPPCG